MITCKLWFCCFGFFEAIKKASSTSIKLTWNAVSGADAYRVYLYNEKTKAYEKYLTLKGVTSYTIKNLSSGTYKYKIAPLLDRFARVYPIIGMDTPYHYRTKVQSALAVNSSGDIISGVYQSATGGVVYCKSGCLLENKRAEKIASAVRKLMRSFKVMPYDRRTGRGTLRHILIKKGFKTGQIMVVLVSATPAFPCGKKLAAALKDEFKDIETVIFTVNRTDTGLLVTGRETVLLGKGYIEDELMGKRFRISAKSFYQVNPVQTEKLYAKAIELAKLDKASKVIDAYCGTGTIGIIASEFAGEVVGCELNEDAVRDADHNARLNGCENVRFFCGDAGQFMQDTAMNGGFVPDVVFMDPPRAGADKAFISALCEISPKKVVYISCNPETMARDVKLLCQGGYKAEGFYPVDMFPHTQHIETVVLLSKGEIDSKNIRVEFSLEDMDMSEFQDGATYTQIKDYVLEHSGLKVSNLYISQIKRKCGIEVGKNYNLPKSEDSRPPQCPPGKEKAIREAFKYFGMI